MSWIHSGFSVHNGLRVTRDDEEGREALVQYSIRKKCSLEQLTYIEETGLFTHLGQPFRLSKTAVQPKLPAPCLGEHTQYVCPRNS